MWYNLFIDIIFLFGGYTLWNISELLKLVIFVKALKTAVVENAKLLANQPAKQVVALLINNAKMLKKKTNSAKTDAAFLGGIFIILNF